MRHVVALGPFHFPPSAPVIWPAPGSGWCQVSSTDRFGEFVAAVGGSAMSAARWERSLPARKSLRLTDRTWPGLSAATGGAHQPDEGQLSARTGKIRRPIGDLRVWGVSGDIEVDGLPALRKLARGTNLLVFNSVVPAGARRVEMSASRLGRRAAKGTAEFEFGCRCRRYPNTGNGSNRPRSRLSVSFTPSQPSATVA